MTALAKDRKTDQLGTPDVVLPQLISFPVAAATSLFGGCIVATNAAGYAVPGSASTALKIWGRCEKQTLNTVAAGYGTAGDLDVPVRQGVFYYPFVETLTIADVGKMTYVADDQTLSLADGAGLYPAAGPLINVRSDGLGGVLLGFPSLYGADDDIALTGYATRMVRARNVLNANVADLAAYTVAANASNNDNILGVAGDVVLLIAQTTAAQNGLYVIGTVAAGVAPLTRLGAMAVGETILAGQIHVSVGVGDLFANSEWKNMTASGIVATNDLAFYPGRVVREVVLSAGHLTFTNIPIFSATKTAFSINRKVANTSTATTGGYVTNGAPTPGIVGTASVDIMAAVAAGTINNADVSTLEVAVINW